MLGPADGGGFVGVAGVVGVVRGCGLCGASRGHAAMGGGERLMVAAVGVGGWGKLASWGGGRSVGMESYACAAAGLGRGVSGIVTG